MKQKKNKLNWWSILHTVNTGLLIFCTIPSLAQTISSAEPKEWTLLVFMNGHNSLEQFTYSDMKEMEEVGSSDKLNLIVLRDLKSNKISTKMYYVEKGKSTVVYDHKKNIDMGDWKNVVEFFKYVKEHYPAKNYFLDIWNHGGGWKLLKEKGPITRGISTDDGTGHTISTVQLGETLRQIRKLNNDKKIEILGMDACLMQMAEVAYQVRDGAEYIAASEEVEPGDGWAYQGFLGALASHPFMSPVELATAVESEYVRSYNNGSQGKSTVQGSVIATQKLSEAKAALAEYVQIAKELAPSQLKSFQDSVRQTQQFDDDDYKDLIHFLGLAKQKIRDASFERASNQALLAIQSSVVANFVVGSQLKNSYGLSIWIPNTAQYNNKKKDYQNLDWTNDTQWNQLIEKIAIAPKYTNSVIENPAGGNSPR